MARADPGVRQGMRGLTQAAQETFDGYQCTVTSRQHSEQAWFALPEPQGKTLTNVERCSGMNWHEVRIMPVI